MEVEPNVDQAAVSKLLCDAIKPASIYIEANEIH